MAVTESYFDAWENKRLGDLVQAALIQAIESPFAMSPEGGEQIMKHRNLLIKIEAMERGAILIKQD